MGRMKKKGESGAKKAYISRRKAMQKLQLNLKDFRRLCILKGIYPVEPKNKHKISNGPAGAKTLYLLSDIQYISHEPILWKFWEFKTFMKRLARARGRQEYDTMQQVKENKPFFKLDKIAKERYPTFIDALRDIDDALSMSALYANFAKTKSIPRELVDACRRVTVEFMHYVIETRSLRKVFVSIKGYYFQAEVQGQTITWVVPHQFMLPRIHDVDFKVMLTFSEFYVTLLGFVNFKLFTSINLYYPPKLVVKAAQDEIVEDEEESFDRIAALNVSLAKSRLEPTEEETKPDEFADEDEEGETITPGMSYHKLTKLQCLFDGMKVFLNREVPREHLTFVLRAFGAEVSWDKVLFSGSTFEENDETITHQIVDREEIKNKYLNRYYIQPQWVFDCVNAQKLLPVEDYFLGVDLPPHLSPFVEHKEGEYNPAEPVEIPEVDEEETMNEEEVPASSKKAKKEEDSESEGEESEEREKKRLKMSVKAGVRQKEDKVRKEKMEKAEEKRLAEMMIPKKKKHLYDKIMFGRKRQLREANKLKEKRIKYEIQKRKKAVQKA